MNTETMLWCVLAVVTPLALVFFQKSRAAEELHQGQQQTIEKLKKLLDESINNQKEMLEERESGVEADLEEALELVKQESRKSRELFDVVEKVLAERDQWRDMWHTHGREHAAAQAMLEEALVNVRVGFRQALVAVNAYRKKDGQEPIPFGVEPNEKPVGSAAKFQAMLDKAVAEAPAPVDGIALRDAVVAH